MMRYRNPNLAYFVVAKKRLSMKFLSNMDFSDWLIMFSFPFRMHFADILGKYFAQPRCSPEGRWTAETKKKKNSQANLIIFEFLV